MSYERMKEKVNDALKNHFRPEFLNRIDETIVFHELLETRSLQMVDLQLVRLTGQLEGQGLGHRGQAAAKELLAEVGYDPTARRPSFASCDPASHRRRAIREAAL